MWLLEHNLSFFEFLASIHDYSIDEVFIDATDYIKARKTTAHDLVRTVIKDVLNTTGITATAGIETILYLCKVAMDIVAKHVEADKDGVRIAELDETSYREKLWNHIYLIRKKCTTKDFKSIRNRLQKKAFDAKI